MKNKIIEHLNLKLTNENNELKLGDIDYLDLNFEANKSSINKIFTLLNCLEGYNKENKFNEHFRYRFDIHNKYNWSIEHIIPQKPDDKTILVYFYDIINYYKEYKKDIDKELEETMQKIEEITNKLSELQYKEFNGNIEKLIEDLKKYLPNFNDFIDSHNIKNLALLDRNTNSSLKNKIFKEKRNILLEFINEEGRFIPPLTLKAFSKTFEGAKTEEMYWTPKDFEEYEKYQEKKLKDFINSIK